FPLPLLPSCAVSRESHWQTHPHPHLPFFSPPLHVSPMPTGLSITHSWKTLFPQLLLREGLLAVLSLNTGPPPFLQHLPVATPIIPRSQMIGMPGLGVDDLSPSVAETFKATYW
ncbi:hypothetical protein H1C71_040564, partial [Ictidomys tridecemlineatus]